MNSSPIPEGEGTEVLLREAQHRVRNDLQTVFSILRLTERRLGSSTLCTEDVQTWLNCLAAVYDAHPIWKQESRISVRTLLSMMRERVRGPSIHSLEDDGSTVSGASGVALALALTCLLNFAAEFADGVLDAVIRSEGGTLVVQLFFNDLGRAGPVWPNLNGRVAAEALGAEFSLRRENGRAVVRLETPCR